MSRKRKYQTEAERKEARRASARRSYHKRKGEKATDNEFERLMRLNPDLYTRKKHLTDEQKQFVASLMNMPLDTKPSINKQTRQTNSIAKQMLGLASSKIRTKNRKPIKSIDFDTTIMKTEQERNYFFENLPDVIYKLLNSINFNTSHWTVYYKYDTNWKTRTLDSITEQYLRDQVKKDLQEHLYDFFEYGSDYDFFPVMIQKLTQIRFINIDQTNPPHGSGRRKHEGKFWRWLLKGFPEINLDRFMIFDKLDKHAVDMIQRDNCFIYACQMAGLNDDLINDMRYSIHKHSMTRQDLTTIARTHDLKIHIKEPGRSYYINPSGSILVRLVLMRNHYMIDEKVSVSSYYILHKKEIMTDRVTRYWSRENKMRIIGIDAKGYYLKSPTNQFSLRKVITALFQVDAFKPITMNDYRAYASLVCFENIDPIRSLEYDDRYCCKLKTSP